MIEKACKLREDYTKAGKSDGLDAEYPPMKVGQQVAK